MDQVTHISGIFANHELQPFLELPWNYERFFKRWVCGFSVNGPIPECMRHLIREVETNLNIKVFSVFCNLLKTGDNYVPYHADQYPFKLMTVSLGATRDFYFKSNSTGIRTHYEMKHGDLMIFPEIMNRTHKHSVPVRKNVNQSRVSILFFYN